jgi:hypothetical protein
MSVISDTNVIHWGQCLSMSAHNRLEEQTTETHTVRFINSLYSLAHGETKQCESEWTNEN